MEVIAVGLGCFAGLVLFLCILPSKHNCVDGMPDIDHQGTYHCSLSRYCEHGK